MHKTKFLVLRAAGAATFPSPEQAFRAFYNLRWREKQPKARTRVKISKACCIEKGPDESLLSRTPGLPFFELDLRLTCFCAPRCCSMKRRAEGPLRGCSSGG